MNHRREIFKDRLQYLGLVDDIINIIDKMVNYNIVIIEEEIDKHWKDIASAIIDPSLINENMFKARLINSYIEFFGCSFDELVYNSYADWYTPDNISKGWLVPSSKMLKDLRLIDSDCDYVNDFLWSLDPVIRSIFRRHAIYENKEDEISKKLKPRQII